MSEETAFSLERKTQPILLALFKKVYDQARKGETLPRIPQGPGRYISKREFLALRRIEPGDSLELIERKIRAFWYPPYQGAEVRIGGGTYTVVNQRVLDQVADMLHR
jgi:methionyl-tRNA formyltransferase